MGNALAKIRIRLLRQKRPTPSWIKQPFTYTGREFDHETGLYYYSGKKAYLCVHPDIYGKMMDGWHLLTAPQSELVVLSWKKAVATVKRLTGSSLTDMIAHQDRGSVYTGADYILAVLKEKCRLSYSRRGEPGDNAVNESFFSRLKEEWRDVFREAQSFDELQKMVKKAIDYYNNERYHSTIGLKAPLIFTKEQVRQLSVQ